MMTSSVALTRLRLAARLCSLGAWLILMTGLAVSIYLSFFVIVNPGNQQPVDPKQLLLALIMAVLIAIPVFFFFLLLYAVGAYLGYMCAQAQPEGPGEERVEITSLSR